MRRILPVTCMISTMVLISTCYFALAAGPEGLKTYGNPEIFEEDIKRFEAEDRRQPPPRGAIVCIGSSSMRGWRKTIHDDLAPLSIIPRGFGGSNMNDLLYYTDRIVLPYRPRAVVVYEGDNDVAQGILPQEIATTFQAFVEKVHSEIPDCRIYFMSIKPSIDRWHLWSTMKEANRLVAAICRKDKRLTYVDVASCMLCEEGTPRKEIFKEDNLHMNQAGYVIWRETLRPVLLQSELEYEKQKPDTTDKPDADNGK